MTEIAKVLFTRTSGKYYPKGGPDDLNEDIIVMFENMTFVVWSPAIEEKFGTTFDQGLLYAAKLAETINTK